MAEAWLMLDILDRMDAEAQVFNLREVRRRLRDEQDPFDVSERQFIDVFRISRWLAMDLIVELTPVLQRTRLNGLSVVAQVLCAVRIYAVGSYQRPTGNEFMIAMSQTSVSRCLRDVSQAIENRFFRRVVKFPETPAERAAAREKFRNARQPFPGAIGAIDCTHVKIVTPAVDEVAYVNHHQYHSINVQIVCDPEMRILNICARFGGGRHDAAIWAQSPVRLLMELYYRQGERGTWLLGDSAYPQEPWLMTRIRGALRGTPNAAYSDALCSSRSYVERCNARFKLIWRCLSGERILMYQPVSACRIINACATLHNLRLTYRVGGDMDEFFPENRIADFAALPVLAAPMNHRQTLNEGRRVREQIVRDHFTP